ncbi:antirestriction protein [Vibrio coralliilyticus]|uniref:antirestriction protein n=1 Tax=Vibrio coralliilyticus TaxID=190893 RepID=UPI000C17190C
MCCEYTGGYWEFIELENGGKYLYPVGDKALKVSNPNNYSAHVMSAKAAGICVTLITLSFYAMKAHERGDDEERDKLATLEYKLYQYARELDEFSSIRSIID